jgi:enoyl-CoA hydratase/carnithine racemase
MSYQNILTERVEKVALITLNRPEKLNAMSYESCELDEELARSKTTTMSRRHFDQPAPRLLGRRRHSSDGKIDARGDGAQRGAVKRPGTSPPSPNRSSAHQASPTARRAVDVDADIRIGCEHAEIQFLAAKYGRANSTWSLPLVVGMPKAKELLFTGRLVKAEEAERIGLLNQVVPCAQLREVSLQMAQQIAENDARMVQGIKKLLNDGVGMSWRERYDSEQSARKGKLKANSPREGFKVFLERKGIRG